MAAASAQTRTWNPVRCPCRGSGLCNSVMACGPSGNSFPCATAGMTSVPRGSRVISDLENLALTQATPVPGLRRAPCQGRAGSFEGAPAPFPGRPLQPPQGDTAGQLATVTAPSGEPTQSKKDSDRREKEDDVREPCRTGRPSQKFKERAR